MLDSTPQSPTPNLTRTGSSPAISTPERSSSPMKGLPFPTKSATPARAETSTISAKGENGLWDDEDARDSRDSSRARRELSVIEESSSLVVKEDETLDASGGDVEEEAGDAGALDNEAEDEVEDDAAQSEREEEEEVDELESESDDGADRLEGLKISTAPDDNVGGDVSGHVVNNQVNPAMTVTT